MIKTVVHLEALSKPIAVLEDIFRQSGLSLLSLA